jgi:SAM-dependent methyltransferase
MDRSSISYEGRDLEAMSFAQNYHTWIASLFRPYLGKKVAEIGAGRGNFSTLLLAEDIEELVCVEPSTEMYPLLVQHTETDTRVSCRQGFFSDVSKEFPEQFDSVVYVNVLEHVERDEDELDVMNSALKKGGYICIFVPALPWLYSDLDASVGHYRRYYKKELEALVQKKGFTIEHSTYFDGVGIIPWFVFFKLFHKKLSPGNTSLYDKVIVPIVRIIESLIPVPIGKNVLLIARKA